MNIVLVDRYKTTFIIDQGASIWVVMFLSLKNAHPLTNEQSAKLFKISWDLS
jgi:hypothetical protein